MLLKSLASGAWIVAALASPTPEVEPRRHHNRRSCGCSQGSFDVSLKGQAVNFSIPDTSTGKRNFNLFVPQNLDTSKPAPLILAFHGRGKNKNQMQRLTRLADSEFNDDYAIVAFPNGIHSPVSADTRIWQGDPEFPAGQSDFDFVDKMISNISDTLCVDETRIYSTGKSNGGGLTELLACDAYFSSRIAAFAPHSAASYMYDGRPECAPSRADVPFLDIHGLNDTTINYYGGPRRGLQLYSVPQTLQEWATRDGCAGSPPANTTTNSYDDRLHKSTWSCDGNDEIVTGYAVEGLGHAWADTIPNEDSETPSFFQATPLIIEFFKRYQI